MEKEVIGFMQPGNSPIQFRKSKLDTFLTKYENKVNANKKAPLNNIKGAFFY
jgi:hypothetical protein